MDIAVLVESPCCEVRPCSPLQNCIPAAIVLAYASPLVGQNWAQIRAWLDVILPVETVLLGSAVGCCFDHRR
jgi:hypothetical protein